MEIKSVMQRVRIIVRSLSRSADEVDDISQDAMIKILRTKSVPRISDKKWLSSVARSCFIEAQRKRARLAKYVSPNHFVDSSGMVCDGDKNEYQNVIPFPPSPYIPHYKDPDALEKAEKIFERLPLSLRQVLVLHTEGLTYHFLRLPKMIAL
ncbi:MAG: hypothetical protein SFY67_11985 [Candidatus Melainabacteria bacterium]|nr:hypothetical protein [Candidatus Melainabacteria bacterium]